MQAITYATFGSPDVLELREVARPAPAPGQVLVRVRAASVNPWDWHFMRGLPYIARLSGAGVRRPKHPILGGDIAGEVEAVGPGVTRFASGDDVFGFIGFGGFAEYVAVPEDALARMPVDLTFEQAASVPLAAMTVLQGLRDVARIQPGQHVLIVGASGGLGTFAVQVAKSFGAVVTGVASGRNLELLRSIGADHVIDYTQTDYLAGGSAVRRRVPARRDDVGVGVPAHPDAQGNAHPHQRRLEGSRAGAARPNPPGGAEPAVRQPDDGGDPAPSERRRSGSRSRTRRTGVVTPVIERTYPLAETAAAIRHLETGRARGKVVISVAPEESARPVTGLVAVSEGIAA